MRVKNPPEPRVFRKTCEELAHDFHLRIMYLFHNRSITKEEILDAIHRFLKGESPESILDFHVKEMFDGTRKRITTITCTHNRA